MATESTMRTEEPIEQWQWLDRILEGLSERETKNPRDDSTLRALHAKHGPCLLTLVQYSIGYEGRAGLKELKTRYEALNLKIIYPTEDEIKHYMDTCYMPTDDETDDEDNLEDLLPAFSFKKWEEWQAKTSTTKKRKRSTTVLQPRRSSRPKKKRDFYAP